MECEMKIPMLTQDVARKLDEYLMSDECGYTLEQLMEVAGLGVAQCVADYIEGQELGHRILLLCGPGNNGGDGLVAARYLKVFGYTPTIAYPKQGRLPFFKRLLSLLEEAGVEVIGDSMNKEQMSGYDLLVDSLFGFGFAGDMLEPFGSLLGEIRKAGRPLISVDVPSGWSVNDGPETGVPSIKPNALISLTLPKQSAAHFKGRHYLAGRFVPEKAWRKFNITPPHQYRGTNMFCQLA